jgi:2-polyprenyl-6-methoxyphenol hydroxylase-like FAD-dependent oxidoreductase
MMKALIIGGGVCGPVTAMALQRAGWDAVIYESRERPLGDAGGYLTVATNGLDALRAIGCEGVVVQEGFPTRDIVMFNGAGKPLGRVPMGSTRDAGLISHTIKRAHLHRALHEEAARRGVRMEPGKRLTGARSLPGGGVRAEFADGSTASGDILIGCDGIHSKTRGIIDPSAPAPRYVGLLNFGGYVPGKSIGEAGAWHMFFGARAFFGYVPDDRGGTVWFANIPRAAATQPERDGTTGEQWRPWLAEWFAGDEGPMAELIGAGDLQLAADNTHDLPRVITWHRASMIVVGDAAHAPSPSSGQGASMAVEDGVVLAQCLRDVPGIDRAFAQFERIRRARVERIVAQGARSSSSKAAGPIGRMVRDRLLLLVFRYVVTPKSMAWIFEHHIEWAAPIASGARVA